MAPGTLRLGFIELVDRLLPDMSLTIKYSPELSQLAAGNIGRERMLEQRVVYGGNTK